VLRSSAGALVGLPAAVEPTAAGSRLRTDSLLVSVALLLGMTVVQRGIGFLRSVLLCRWLSPEDLGQWDLALGFLELAAPVAVLGIPGSFGRYVQRYLRSGQFGSFLRQTAIVSAVLTLAASLAVYLAAATFSDWIFGTPDNAGLVRWLALALLALVSHFFLMTVLTGLLQNRAAYRTELVQSLGFTALALLVVGGLGGGAGAVVIAYMGACSLAVACGWICLKTVLPATASQTQQSLSPRALWPALLPFSLWVWGTNWLSNLFDLADRAMLVHFSGLPAQEALELVGNYHSARIVPLVLVAVTSSLATMLTPYLSRDWEAGQREQLRVRMTLLVKVVGCGLTAASILILWISPLLFHDALKGKYLAGQAVLPWTLTYCVWFGMARMAQKYLWCTERVGLAAAAWGAGLAVNIALNLWLLPRLGLPGVVLATAAGNLTSLLLIALFNARSGLRADVGLAMVVVLPLLVHLGPAHAAAMLALVLVAVWGTSCGLHADERRLLESMSASALERLQARRLTSCVDGTR
jgi:O-antigen/teichoic acid export membrane protein